MIRRHEINFYETKPDEAGVNELQAKLVLCAVRVFQLGEYCPEPEKEIIRDTLIRHLENCMYGDARRAARDFMYFALTNLPRGDVTYAQHLYDELVRTMKIGDN